jgi:predicted permease
MATLLQDLRYAARLLAKHPGFTFAAALCLALGIGANSAIFSVVDAVLLRPLPYPEPERLVAVWNQMTRRDLPRLWASDAEFLDFRARNEVFSELAGYYQPTNLILTGREEPERLPTAIVSADFFPALGVKAEVGRLFLPQEDTPGNEAVVVLTNGLWKRRFGGDRGIVGQTLNLSGNSFTVVGILPESFRFFPREVELVVPLALDPAKLDPRTSRYLFLLGRLKPGVSVAAAQESITLLASRFQQEHPDVYPADSGWGMLLVPLREEVVGDVRPLLTLLLGAVSLVLLIACVNVANLLLARAAIRQREVALRTAIGASRTRLLRQLLTETLLLALIGGGLGLVLGAWGVRALLSVYRDGLPRAAEVGLDARVFLFTLAASLVAGLVSGLLPALLGSRSALHETLKQGGRSGGGNLALRRLHATLVVAEVALALVLLVAAGLVVRSFARLQQVDPGFRPDQVVTMRLSLPSSRYAEEEKQRAFYRDLVARVGALPGVTAAGAVSNLPLSGSEFMGGYQAEGITPEKEGDPIADWRSVTPGYFDALRIPLLQGRTFTDGDHDQAQRVVVVDDQLVRRIWGEQDPLGRRLRLSGLGDDAPWLTVVGVVRHVQHYGLDVESREQLYLPFPQFPQRGGYLAVRTALEPGAAVTAVRSELREIDRDLPVSEIHPLADLLAESLAPRRFSLFLFALFAAVALALSAVGIYGVLAYSVAQRTREIGLRQALGARQGSILSLVVGQAMKMAAVGVVLGLAGSLVLGRFLGSVLFEVAADDPFTLAAVSLFLLLIALVASYLPAARALRVAPVEALRAE